MGIYLSTTAYSPLALTSTTFGLIAFVFTLGTFIKVLWDNFQTLGEPPHVVHRYLTSLRQELLEERASIRVMRKQDRKDDRLESDADLHDVSLKTMSDVIKHLIKQFEDIEGPFLAPGERGIRDAGKRRRSTSPYYQHSAYASPEKSRRRRSAHHEDDPFWAQRTRYADYGLGKRWTWLRKKPKAQDMTQTLTRVQVRRIARQMCAMSILVQESSSVSTEIEEMVRRIDERTSRILGVRRVDGDG